LDPAARAQLAAWLARKEALDWDTQMHTDAETGKLDFLFHEANAERATDQLKNWPPPQ
jgi:anti-sigma factor RsiW